MWTVISFLFLVATVYGVSEEYMKQLKFQVANIAATCIPEVGATEGDVAELLSEQPPTTRTGQCLVSCFQKKFGFQDSNGRPDKEGTLALLEPLHDEDIDMYNKILQIVLVCGPEVQQMPITDHCDVAMAIGTCAIREGKKYGLNNPFLLNR
ncbi:hypothetical protein FQA39_LY04398 [Lamprigera yunnana]|nr:hypothetical protein FQA39_LY04398 [Lamprigera yunnana]